LEETDVMKDENEIMQQADRAILGKSIVYTILNVVPGEHEKVDHLNFAEVQIPRKERCGPARQNHRVLESSLATSIEATVNNTSKLNRKEGKRSWY